MREVRRPRRLTRADAEAIAARGFLFLAEESGRLGRFLADTGFHPEALRAQLDEPELMLAVLAHLMSDQSALLAFCANAGIAPEDVAAAELELGGAAAWDST